MDPLVFEDTKGNSYLYSFAKRKMLYVNKILSAMIKRYLETKSVEIDSCFYAIYKEDEIDKNHKRLLFLIDKGYLDSFEYSFNPDIKYNEIENSISNIRQVCFELTQKCNLSCTYCCYGDLYIHDGNNHSLELDINIAYCFIDSLCSELIAKNNGSVRRKIILGFYGGEPLLKFDMIKKIVEYSDSKSCDDFYFEYILTTNGLLLNKCIDFFVQHRFSLMISLDGDFYNSGYRITKGGQNVFRNVFENISEIYSIYPDYFKNYITFNSVIHDKNSVKDVLLFFYHKFHKIPQISELATDPINKDRYGQFERMYKKAIGNYCDFSSFISKEEYIQLDKTLKNIPSFFYKVLNMNINSWVDLFYGFDYRFFPGICMPFTNKIFISADGKLHLCEHIGYGFPIGYVDIKNKEVVFNRNELAERYSKIFQKMESECSKCMGLITCTTCVFQKRMKCKAKTAAEFIREIVLNMDLLREREEFVTYN